jgi:hypothetical protein
MIRLVNTCGIMGHFGTFHVQFLAAEAALSSGLA